MGLRAIVIKPRSISAIYPEHNHPATTLALGSKGSGVIRGKLIVTPIANSFIYVAPLHLKAEGSNFLQLKQVIVTTGDKAVIQPKLDEVLGSLFGSARSRILVIAVWRLMPEYDSK